MKLLTLATCALTLAFALASDSPASNKSAPATNDNPWRVSYQATLQADKLVQGSIVGVSGENGMGVYLDVNFFSFPDGAGPFEYHIHENPVPSNGSCNATGEHLDPFNVTEIPPCRPQSPSTCQVGDLSGKHGKINESDLALLPFFQTQYPDLYLSTSNNSVAFFGNRSLVVHAANGTRLNCGSFVLLRDFSGANDTTGAITTQTGDSPASATATTRVSTSTSAGGSTTGSSSSITSPSISTSTGGAVAWQAGVNLAMAVGALGAVFVI